MAVRWDLHRGERWAIDSSCLLYRAKGAGLSPVTVLASLFVRMRLAGIEPVVVFDGKPPVVKAEVVEQRRAVREATQKEIAEIKVELTEKAATLTEVERAHIDRRIMDLQKKAPQVSRDDKDELKKFLYACGILFITANGEADDVLAAMCRRGDVKAVVSTDMDMLARGIPLLVIPEVPDASVLSVISLPVVLTGLGLTYPQFVDACMLMGSDYSSKHWQPMPPPLSVDMARAGVDWATVDPSGCEVMAEGARLLRGEGVVWESLLSERQLEKWVAGAPPREPEALAAKCTSQGWPLEWYDALMR